MEPAADGGMPRALRTCAASWIGLQWSPPLNGGITTRGLRAAGAANTLGAGEGCREARSPLSSVELSRCLRLPLICGSGRTRSASVPGSAPAAIRCGDYWASGPRLVCQCRHGRGGGVHDSSGLNVPYPKWLSWPSSRGPGTGSAKSRTSPSPGRALPRCSFIR